jgi:hypothetical protein
VVISAWAYVIGAGIAALAVIASPIVSAVIFARIARRAADQASSAADKAAAATANAELATAQARRDAAMAQRQASEAATKLIETARGTDRKLATLQETANDTNAITKVTHKIVNSDRTKILGTVAYLARRVADANPGNKQDEAAALLAEDESQKSIAAGELVTQQESRAEADAIADKGVTTTTTTHTSKQ